jgi:SAM-dependent methyltransferase
MIRSLLAHPLTRGMDIDDPRTTELRRRVVREKAFLRRIYEEWYGEIAALVPDGPGQVLELGSGPGFLEEYLPGLITSEILYCDGVRVVLDAGALPFREGSLRAIVLVDVLHHLREPRRFLGEAARAVRPGGALVLHEPWVSAWSRFVYRWLHYEPFDDRGGWECEGAGPLSRANNALPWILFERDRAAFERELPQWRVDRIEPGMPFRYLVSGGVTMRDLMPGAAFGAWRWLERRLRPWMKSWAMFAIIRLVRR